MPQRRKLSKIGVLVVDDFPDGLDLVAEYLQFRGFLVHIASNGLDALRVARAAKPQTVLMDLSMPGVDGWQATKTLKNDPATKGICVIAVTAHALAPERAAATAAGCDGVICKPFNLSTLADALPRVLKHGAKALDVPGLSLALTTRPGKTRRNVTKN